MSKKLEKVLISNGKKIKGLKILDIGCFTGDFLNIFKKRGADVYGVEIQKEASRKANTKFPGKVFNKDILQIKDEIKSNSMDCITMLGLIEHVRDPKETLAMALKFLKPNGVLMIQTPDTLSLPARFVKKYWPPYTPVEHIYLFSRKSLYLELKKNFTEISFTCHWKKMPFDYLYNILNTFGPSWRNILKPIFTILPSNLKRVSIPFYVGEIICFAVKKSLPND
jgi:SAM-dependent methyltransferase